MKSIAHLTSAHPRYDTRIFLKQCSSLAKKNNYNITLVVADNGNKEKKNGVDIIPVLQPKKRFERFLKTTKLVFKQAIDLNADLYHIHDPELIPIGLKLKKKGKVVIFDAHEDLPKQLKSKPYLNKILKVLLPLFFSWYEKFSCKKFDAIVTVTKAIEKKFQRINSQTVLVSNYPIINEFNNSVSWSEKSDEVCYVGGISEIRGIKDVVRALHKTTDVKLNLVGEFNVNELQEEVTNYAGWDRVKHLGFLSRNEVSKVLERSFAGIVTFYPVPNHIDAQPNKMFEYMSAGIPVIGSHFPLWKEIIEKNECGITVDPQNPTEIANAINYIQSNPDKAKKMSENGLKAVRDLYNWSIEEKKLFDLYKVLIGE